MEGAAAAILEFNKGLIHALCEIVPAVKPQCAYYEMYGWQGVKTLHDTIAYASEKGMFVITDGKRNDIGATMEAYAAALPWLDGPGGRRALPTRSARTALTVNGYLGPRRHQAAASPSARRAGYAASLSLVKTSNPSSGELQDQKFWTNGETLYRHDGRALRAVGRRSLPGKYGYSGRRRGGRRDLSGSSSRELRAAMPLDLLPRARLRGAGRRR